MEKNLKSKIEITDENRKNLVGLVFRQNHGGSVETDGWSVYSFKKYPVNKNTGNTSYFSYSLSFIAFVDDNSGENKMPLYYESDNLEKVILWLYEQVY